VAGFRAATDVMRLGTSSLGLATSLPTTTGRRVSQRLTRASMGQVLPGMGEELPLSVAGHRVRGSVKTAG